MLLAHNAIRYRHGSKAEIVYMEALSRRGSKGAVLTLLRDSAVLEQLADVVKYAAVSLWAGGRGRKGGIISTRKE